MFFQQYTRLAFCSLHLEIELTFAYRCSDDVGLAIDWVCRWENVAPLTAKIMEVPVAAFLHAAVMMSVTGRTDSVPAGYSIQSSWSASCFIVTYN